MYHLNDVSKYRLTRIHTTLVLEISLIIINYILTNVLFYSILSFINYCWYSYPILCFIYLISKFLLNQVNFFLVILINIIWYLLYSHIYTYKSLSITLLYYILFILVKKIFNLVLNVFLVEEEKKLTKVRTKKNKLWEQSPPKGWFSNHKTE